MTVMERFALPEQLPATVEELNELLSTAMAHITLIQARANVGEKLSDDDVAYLRSVLDARDTLTTEIAALQEAEVRHRQDLADLLSAPTGRPRRPRRRNRGPQMSLPRRPPPAKPSPRPRPSRSGSGGGRTGRGSRNTPLFRRQLHRRRAVIPAR